MPLISLNWVWGKHDNLPESAFLFVGTIDEAVAKAKGEH